MWESSAMGSKRKRGTPQEAGPNALLDSLVKDAAASVRPASEEEAKEKKALRLRQAAEALLNVGDRVNSPEFKQQHGQLWAPLMLALDARLTEVLEECPYEDEGLWDGDNSTLQDRLAERPAAAAVMVRSSLGAGGLTRVGTMERLMASMAKMRGFKDDKAKLSAFEEMVREQLTASSSTQRPPLACDLARFDACWSPAGAASGSDTGGSSSTPAAAADAAAVAEARCEVTFSEEPSAGRVAVGGGYLAFVGGGGWKQRSPFLEAGRISGCDSDSSSEEEMGDGRRSDSSSKEEMGDGSNSDSRSEEEMGDGSNSDSSSEEEMGDGSNNDSSSEEEMGDGSSEGDDDDGETRTWQSGIEEIQTGFFERGFRVALDPVRGLVWSSGGESRIKAFSIEQEDEAGCQFTLDSQKPKLLGVLGGRVLSALGGGEVEWWDIARLTPQRQWIPAGEVFEEDAEEMERKWGCKVFDGIDGSMNDEAEEAEATGGEEAHGRIQLLGKQPAASHVLQELLPLGAEEGDSPPQQVVGCMEDSSCAWVWDWPTATLTGLLTGHGAVITCASTSPGLPNLVAAGSYDTKVRVWDLRSGGTCTHMLTSKSSLGVKAVALAEYQGQPFCFSSCNRDESILCWDLRMRRCLYELATGNTDVCSLQWHAPTSSLFASTDCDYIDRLGGLHDYGAMEGVRWPQCMHKPSDFPRSWDAGEHLLIRYAFKDAPDKSILPPAPEPDPEWDGWGKSEDGEDDSSEDEEAKRERKQAWATWRPSQQEGWW